MFNGRKGNKFFDIATIHSPVLIICNKIQPVYSPIFLRLGHKITDLYFDYI